MKSKKFWIPSIIISVYSISSNRKATILAIIPGKPRHSSKMHLVSSKRSIRNICVVLNPRPQNNGFPLSLFLFMSSMFFVLFYLAILLFFSSETSLSRRGGIVRTRHGRRSIGWFNISLAHLHRIYSVVLFILSASLEPCNIRDNISKSCPSLGRLNVPNDISWYYEPSAFPVVLASPHVHCPFGYLSPTLDRSRSREQSRPSLKPKGLAISHFRFSRLNY